MCLVHVKPGEGLISLPDAYHRLLYSCALHDRPLESFEEETPPVTWSVAITLRSRMDF